MPELFCKIRLFFNRRTSLDYHSSHEQHLAAVFLEKIHLLPGIRSFRTIISGLNFVRREVGAMKNDWGGRVKGRKLGGGGVGRKII